MREEAHDPEVLLQHYLEDSLTEAEASALLELLQRDPSLSARLMDQLHLDAMLRSEGASPMQQTAPVSLSDETRILSPVTSKKTRWLPMTTVAALAACVTLAGTWLFNLTNDAEETTSAVAVLMRGVDAQWEGRAPQVGTPLTPGMLRLKSGLAQIEFYQGARVTLEGPASFELISVSEARCTSGKLSAHVPPQAKGFRIQTPKGTVVDLGTDFGLDMNSPEAQVHVFKGEVELHPDGAKMQPLKEGEAALFSDTVQRREADQSAFASLGDMDERTAESQRVSFEQWLQSSTQWDADPALLLRLNFQDPSHTRVLRNHALKAEKVPAGSIVGCQWTEGRWAGKRALEFRNISDRVRLSIPGDHEALTLSTWVRIHGLDRAYNSLFMVEGYKDGAVHWQITRTGELRLGIAGRNGHGSKDHDTPAIFTPERFGQWLHLATCLDPVANEVRHYVNGELMARVPRNAKFPVHMPVAELGNWNDGRRGGSVAIRHLSGVMDEFMLFNRVLSEAEIAKLAH
ncbi:MAG: LamG-like jellyroll fold domain-containing protein [Verrucomicrobiota bacterium]